MSNAGPVMNCAGRGNFQLDSRSSPSDAGMACPDGSWKRGRYDFFNKGPGMCEAASSRSPP